MEERWRELYINGEKDRRQGRDSGEKNVNNSLHFSDSFVVFSGGLCVDKTGRTPSITVVQGKTTTVLEMEHTVVDFTTLCENPYASGTYMCVLVCVRKRAREKIICLQTPNDLSLSLCDPDLDPDLDLCRAE